MTGFYMKYNTGLKWVYLKDLNFISYDFVTIRDCNAHFCDISSGA